MVTKSCSVYHLTLSLIDYPHPSCHVQDLQGQLHSAGLQLQEYEKMQAACGQLQATITALHSETRTLMENRDKMQSVATEAVTVLKTQQKQAADTVRSLKLKHAEELQV